MIIHERSYNDNGMRELRTKMIRNNKAGITLAIYMSPKRIQPQSPQSVNNNENHNKRNHKRAQEGVDEHIATHPVINPMSSNDSHKAREKKRKQKKKI